MYKTVPINEHAYLELYLLDNLDNAGSQAENLPILLILPGGSYTYTSNREAQPIALSANTKAMHAAVLRYTVIPDKKDLTVDDLLAEVKAALDYIEEHSKEYRIDSKRIYLIGFSAGGHLASWASIKFYDRIDRVILAYQPFLYEFYLSHQIFSLGNFLSFQFLRLLLSLQLPYPIPLQLPYSHLYLYLS